jgi:uncharacterized phage protein (TIGR02220 family)
MSDLIFTHVYERARQKIGITRDEYALVNYIHTWAGYPGNARPGWCDRTLSQKAKFVGITERGLTKMQNRMIEINLVEKDPVTAHVRATKIWFEIILEAKTEEGRKPVLLGEENADEQGTKFRRKGEQSSVDGGNKVPLNGEQSSVDGGNKVPPHNKGFLFNPNESDNKDIKVETENPVEVVIRFLNQVTGASFKPGTADTVSSINARLKEGYSIDELLLVVEHKAAEWLHDAEMCDYLRPITLFGKKKFESYVQASTRWQNSGKPKLSKNGKFPSSGNGNVRDSIKNSVTGAFE